MQYIVLYLHLVLYILVLMLIHVFLRTQRNTQFICIKVYVQEMSF